MAFEPSGKTAGKDAPRSDNEVYNASLPPREQFGLAESSALFRTVLDLPVELRALRDHIDPVFLRWAAARAETLGIGGDAIVRRSGIMHPDAMLEAYAKDLGIEIDLLDDTMIAPDVAGVLSSGILPVGSRRQQNVTVVALSGENIGKLYENLDRDPGIAERTRVASPERLRALVESSGAALLATDAAFGLQKEKPSLSAGLIRFAEFRAATLAMLLAASLSLYLFPKTTLFAIEAALAAVFLAWAALRVFACFSERPPAITTQNKENELPLYSILVPLHREARIVPDLVRAISSLNYPREKLDVKLILEFDDAETIAAVHAIHLDPCFEMVIAPPLGPRTKPKALRAALPFVQGEFVVVYDAEDRPDPDQLRAAYARFRGGPEKLACVQAKLAIDNTFPAFLTSHFRAEYSGLFEVLLPALARLRLPVPLGGTSNHFRTKVLREVGGWDPHNVTEDADLGVRLARYGYTTGVVDSTTWEEAPARLGAWLPQRTRWMKGWLQTYFVHMRNPFLLFKELGLRGFLAFQLLIGGTVLAALVHPVFVLWLLADSAFGSLFEPAQSATQWAQKGLVFMTLMSGYLASGLLAFVGLRRRGLFSSVWVLLTIPIYWLLLSAAAWRAVWKLITAPYQWEKTEHGVVRRNSALL